MKPFFFTYKNISITWFIFFAMVSATLGYILASILAVEYEEEKNKIQDVYMILLIVGFVGARLGYALIHPNLYKDNIYLLFKISHYNLSLIGGILSSLLALTFISKRYNIKVEKLLNIFIIPFYFSMALGIWVVKFNRLILSLDHIKILGLSLMFLLSALLQLILSKRLNNKYISIIILGIAIILYYIVVRY